MRNALGIFALTVVFFNSESFCETSEDSFEESGKHDGFKLHGDGAKQLYSQLAQGMNLDETHIDSSRLSKFKASEGEAKMLDEASPLFHEESKSFEGESSLLQESESGSEYSEGSNDEFPEDKDMNEEEEISMVQQDSFDDDEYSISDPYLTNTDAQSFLEIGKRKNLEKSGRYPADAYNESGRLSFSEEKSSIDELNNAATGLAEKEHFLTTDQGLIEDQLLDQAGSRDIVNDNATVRSTASQMNTAHGVVSPTADSLRKDENLSLVHIGSHDYTEDLNEPNAVDEDQNASNPINEESDAMENLQEQSEVAESLQATVPIKEDSEPHEVLTRHQWQDIATTDEEKKEPETSSKGQVGMIVGIVLLAILIIVAILIALRKRMRRRKDRFVDEAEKGIIEN